MNSEACGSYYICHNVTWKGELMLRERHDHYFTCGHSAHTHLRLDLGVAAENVRIVLMELAHSREPTQRARLLIAVCVLDAGKHVAI